MNNVERLYYMLQENDCNHWFRDNADTLSLAEYLDKKGCIVPPCKVGDDLWWIDENNEVNVQKNGIRKIVYCGDGKFGVLDKDGYYDDIGTTYAYLSREEAEKALKEGAE